MRTIDYIFSSLGFKYWLEQLEQPYSGVFYLLRQLGHVPEPGLLETAKMLEMLKQAKSIRKNERHEQYALILARLLLSGDGTVIQRILQPYDNELAAYALAGLLNTSREYRDNLVAYIALGVHENDIREYLIYLATEGEKLRMLSPFEINTFAVNFWADPRRIFDIVWLDRFVRNFGNDAPLLTQRLSNAFKTIEVVRDNIKAIENGSQKRLTNFLPAEEALALILNTVTEIKVQTRDDQQKSLQLSMVSALDMLYGNNDNFDVYTWIDHSLDTAQIDKQTVIRIENDKPGSHLNFAIDHDLNVKSGFQFVDFLVWRFGKIFELAVLFTSYFRACTLFDVDSEGWLTSWFNSGLIPIQRDFFHRIPLILAAEDGENLESRKLYFANHLATMNSWRHNEGLSSKLGELHGATNEAKELIINLFLDVAHKEDANSTQLGFLRPKKEIESLLAQYALENLEVIEGVDFSDYLMSLNYHDMSQPKQEYMGLKGLSKAVEIHSLSHIHFGDIYSSEGWPYYNPDLMMPETDITSSN